MNDSSGEMQMADGGDAGAAGDDARAAARDAALRTLIPAHALGATDSDDAAAIEDLVARDASAAAELAYFKPLRNALLYSAESVLPPPALEARLRAATLPASAHAAPAQQQPVQQQPTIQPHFQAAAHEIRARPRWKRWFAPATRPAWTLAAVALALLIATNLWWGAQTAELRETEAATAAVQATAQVEQAAAARATVDSRIAAYNQLLAAAAAGRAATAMLPAADAAPTADTHAMVIWKPGNRSAMIMAEQFPALQPGKIYQIWLLHGEDRMSGGLFSVDDNGSAMMMVESPMPFDALDGIGITLEPASGSPAPTGGLVVRGAMQTVSG